VKHDLVLPETLLTEEELVIELAARVRKRGDHQRVAGELGVSQPALSNVLTGGRGIGKDLAHRLGYRRVTRFEPIGT
jgi:predicted transcriptional regulator